MVGKAELSEGQKQLVKPTISGTHKAEARRADVEERLQFKGGIGKGPQGPLRDNAQPSGGNQPVKSGSRGTIVNITA